VLTGIKKDHSRLMQQEKQAGALRKAKKQFFISQIVLKKLHLPKFFETIS